MQPPAACPGAAPLQHFLLGQATEADAARLEQHLLACPRCFQTLAGMAGEKELALATHGQAAAPAPRHPVIGRLLEKMRHPRPPAPLPSLLNTGAFSMTNTEPSLATGPNDETSHLLGPAQGPGELGRLGGYRVLRVLGVGGMGTVYEAEDTTLRRRVALKTMKPGVASLTGARERFLREARSAAALSHDHIVPIYQVGEDRGVAFLAMPLLHGEMLEDRLKRVGRLPLAEALRIGREIAEGLAAAHDHGIIHRDIKPGNIWLESPNNRVKIVDFGLASCPEGDVQLTTPGTILGTPAYMAPEQAGGPIDHRADLFSLGCVLYRMATGRMPFAGASTMEILRNIAVQPPRPPRELNPEIPAAMDQFLVRLLAKEREQRPVSAAVVAKVLQTLEGQLSNTLLIAPPTKPPLAVQIGPGGKPAAAPAAAQAIQQVRNAPPSPHAQTIPQIQNAPPPVGGTVLQIQAKPPRPAPTRGFGAALKAHLGALQAWFLALSPRNRLYLTAGSAGAALVGLALVLTAFLMPRGNPRTTDPGRVKDGDSVVEDHGPHASKFTWQTIPPRPPRLTPEIPENGPLNANSFVSRPPKIEGLVNWDIISDKIDKTISSISFTSGGRLELGASGVRSQWDFDQGSLVPAPFGGSYAAIAPDQSICARLETQSVPLFVPDRPSIARTLLTGGVTAVSWSHGGDYVATYGGEGLVIWNPKQARRVGGCADLAVSGSNVGEFVWAPDDQSIVAWLTAGHQDVYYLDVATGKVKQKITPEGRVLTVRLHPEGEEIAVHAYDDSKIRVYDLKRGTRLYTFPNEADTPPAWSPDGKLLAVGVGAGVQVWDCASWDEPKLRYTLDQTKVASKNLVFSPHGETLFTNDGDGKVRLWDVESGLHRGTIALLSQGWLAVTAEGDYRAADGSAEAGQFRYQALEKDATNDLSPKEFEKAYKWKNDFDKPKRLLR